ncbi:hypothetical protein [Pseudomonas aeruginosa]|uniref:hypothetical protein n=1 Tax=Pseudomonas aeruginosa TaxID=287 RepID=UPI000FC4296E|nr:hypothetical protein [Pseudomonas aeruginosa]RUI34559.1 hypothetical protein IPC443_03515 [Pseudomonas aeruginosa]
MTDKQQPSKEFELLQRIDGRLERFEQRFPQVERKAVQYGAAAGALAGGVVACGLAVARMKLGI